MRDIEAPWVGADYEPMTHTDEPWAVCDYCGEPIYAGQMYLDVSRIMCENCMEKYTQRAG